MPVLNKLKDARYITDNHIQKIFDTMYFCRNLKRLFMTPDQYFKLRKNEDFMRIFDPCTELRKIQKGYMGRFIWNLLGEDIDLEFWIYASNK